MARLSLLVLALGAAGLGPGCERPHSSAAPGSYEEARRSPVPVFLIVIDTLRLDHLGAFGYDRPTTPHLDALAAEGIVFERAYAQSTWTKPTTASILTGQYPSVHGVMQGLSSLPESLVTMAEALQREGYGTAAVVANGFVSNAVHGFRQGFDLFEGEEAFEKRFLYPRAEPMIDHAIAQIDALRNGDAKRPVFCYVHLMDPHMPYDPVEPWRTRFARDYTGDVGGSYGTTAEPGEPGDLTTADLAHLMDLYDAEIASADAQIGRLFSTIKERGLWEDALVIVLSDHGEEFLDHGGLRHGPTMYQELVHVPLLVKAPRGRGFPSALKCERIAMQIDLLPTVLDVIGARVPADLPGTSLFARCMPDGGAPDSVAFGQVDQKGVIRAMAVEGSIKYVRQLAPSAEERLTDLRLDPEEKMALSPADGALLDRMSGLLDAHTAADRRRTGFVVVLVNRSDRMIELNLRIGTRAAHLQAIEPRHLELRPDPAPGMPRGHDQPLGQTREELDGRPLFVTGALLRTAPGDRDGIGFVTVEADDLAYVDLRVDGQVPDLDHVQVGSSPDRTITGMPLVLDRDDESLVASDPSRRGIGSQADYRIYIWHKPSFRAEERKLDDEAVENLRKLGYFESGDD